MEFPEDTASQDAVQNLLNDEKKAALEKRFGMRFHRDGPRKIPPDVEAQWLDFVEEFEEKFETAEEVPLRQFAGFPEAPPIATLAPDKIEEALEKLLEHLAAHEVFIDFPDEVEAPEAYRFVTEELLDEPVHDIRIPGMRCRFVYEEFRA
jgi:hypothetical protein